jgi:putative PIG3 family NAD(P)H quinone oxidoreductase
MRAVTLAEFGGPENLQIASVADPTFTDTQVLVEVYAAALNRADLLQRRGKYPPPPGESEILGLECAGVVVARGANVTHVNVGDRVMSLLAGGGYAEWVAIDARMAIPIPGSLSFVEAAAIPEGFLTAREALFSVGKLQPKDAVLIHAAAGGVGSAAVQLAKVNGSTVFATAGSEQKLRFVESIGAKFAINYKTSDFASVIKDATGGSGVHVVLDCIGASYWEQHARCMADGGRCVVIGVMGGAQTTVNFSQLLFRRLQLVGLVMRTRPLLDKIAMTQRFIRESLPLLASGHLKPVIDRVYDLASVSEAHRRMESNENVGKIILKVRD